MSKGWPREHSLFLAADARQGEKRNGFCRAAWAVKHDPGPLGEEEEEEGRRWLEGVRREGRWRGERGGGSEKKED